MRRTTWMPMATPRLDLLRGLRSSQGGLHVLGHLGQVAVQLSVARAIDQAAALIPCRRAH